MILSFGYVALYAVIVGIASFVERPLGRGIGAYQLNVLIRVGSLATSLAALFATHGLTLPPISADLSGLGLGLISGAGSILYCFALADLPVSLVVVFANLYILPTTLLGIAVLREPITVPKIVGILCTIVGVTLLSHTPSRYAVDPENRCGQGARRLRAYIAMAAYVVVIGVVAFLEKPALSSLDATQLNGLMALSMTAVACLALGVERPKLVVTRPAVDKLGVGAMIGAASVFYFLGLRQLPVSIAAASSNSYVVVTMLLSTVFLRERMTVPKGAGMILTILGVTLLALIAP